MIVPHDELANIILRSTVGVSPRESESVSRVKKLILEEKIAARLDSPHSKFLQESVLFCGETLKKEAVDLLNSIEIYGVNVSYANAIPEFSRGKRRIFVFNGILQTIRHFADTIRIVDGIQTLRPDRKFLFGEEEVDESIAFSMASFSILSHALENHTSLPNLRPLLGPIAQRHVEQSNRLAVAFILLHELGHFECKHLGLDLAYSERQHFSLLEPEKLSEMQACEMEADYFAMSMISEEHAMKYIPSILFLLGSFAFFEAFSGNLSDSHPLAINRMGALAAQTSLPAEVRQIAEGWIHGRLEGWRTLAATRDEVGGEALRARIDQTISLPVAYQTLFAIGMEILSTTGPLDPYADE